MQAAATLGASQRYAKAVEVSKRIRWDIERDVIKGRTFDYARKFLPDGLSKVDRIDGLSAAVTYYGGGMTTPQEAQRKPKVPVMAHFGQRDHWITMESVQAFEKAHPEVEVHVYDADHGFNCDQRGSYDASAAATARERTLYFFGKHLG